MCVVSCINELGIYAIVEQIDNVLTSISDIKKWHDLRVRSNGGGYEIDINIHVKPTLTLVEAHEISERLENEIRSLIGVATINVHVEPDD